MNLSFKALVALVALVSFCGHQIYGHPCGVQENSVGVGFRVVGGDAATANEFPWVVSLIVSGDNHCCGGTILTRKWVLTAAHCLYGLEKHSKWVVAGALKTKSGYKTGTQHFVVREILHPKYNSTSVENDIALIKIRDEFKWRNEPSSERRGIFPACLPDAHETFIREKVDAVGFGLTKFKGKVSEYLKKVKIRVYRDEVCLNYYPRTMKYRPEMMCCAGALQRKEGTCQGDSGGPLTTSCGKVIGVVSFGAGCGEGIPTVFAKVQAYLDWIKKHVPDVSNYTNSKCKKH